MASDERIRSILRTRWHRTPRELTEVADSRWRAEVDDGPVLVTLIPVAGQARLLAGLAVAEHLAHAGFPTGRPVRAADGAVVVLVDEGVVAVVRDVPGRPLDPNDPLDQQWWGDMLGAAHRALTGFGDPRVTRLARLNPEGAHLDIAPWLRPTVLGALAAVTRLTVTDQLTYGVLHGDPAPDVFRIDPETGRTGLVDWRAAATGPLVYDLAAAVGYAGGMAAAAELIDGYLAAAPVPAEEAEAALPVLLRYRLAERLDALARAARGGGAPDWAALAATRSAIEELEEL